MKSGYGAYKDIKGAVGSVKSFGTEAGKTIAAAETGNVFGAAYGAYKTYKVHGREAFSPRARNNKTVPVVQRRFFFSLYVSNRKIWSRSFSPTHLFFDAYF
jgi:hypothetical protein